MRINSNIKKDAPEHVIQKRFFDITRAVNGNISFGNPKDGAVNITGSWQELVTPNVSGTEFTLTHNLGYIPTGIIVVSLDLPAVIYASRKSSWTTKVAFFKANLASVALTGFII
jgi:putative copper export protein